MDGPGPGAWNMALDEALMAGARHGLVTLRFYRWDPPCLSFGRNERARGAYDPGAAAGRGVDLVRRPTGGRAVYHHRELTYSLTAPSGAWGGLREVYGRINRALGRGLRSLGVVASPASTARRVPGAGKSRLRWRLGAAGGAGGISPRACFGEPAPGEVTVDGRKLVGSAQWRLRGALLQHGSILLHDDQLRVDELRRAVDVRGLPPRGGIATAGTVVAPAVSLAELCTPPPPLKRLVRALTGGFEEEFGLRASPGMVTPEERRAARRLVRRYSSPEWTWRR